MKLFISIIVCICAGIGTTAQNINSKPVILYGLFSADSLTTAPFNKWFNKTYDDYQPESITVASFKKQSMKDISIQVFLGTWCGDSKREVPRFIKLVNSINFPIKQLKLIGLGATDSLYKKSPQGEEKGLGIFRVPTFVIYRKGIEINRINEYPALSLEKDLLKIISNQPLQPNYRSLATVTQWLNDGTLLDANSSSRSLAAHLKPLVNGENELNSLGYLLLSHQQKKEALKIFQVNSLLFPESANITSSMAEGYFENGDYTTAVTLLEKSLEQNKDPQAVKGMLVILYKAKQKTIQ